MTTAIPVVNATPAGNDITTPPIAAAYGKTLLVVQTGGTTANLGLVATKVVPDGALPGQALPGRTKALAANKTYIFGPFPPDVWNDTNGNLGLTFDAITAIITTALRVAVSP